MAGWNPWHGCRKISEGCRHCYVYRIDERHGRDASAVVRTTAFGDPVKKKRSGEWKIPSGSTVYTCFSSDFFVDQADPWRAEAWAMMRHRPDLHFFFITKRIHRFMECIPDDWGDGYDNVTICCTVEDQAAADFRLPIYREVPIREKIIICEPLIGPIDLSPWLGEWVGQVSVGGESGPQTRPCHYPWVISLREQCQAAGISFRFRQTGARFVKDGILYRIPRRLQRSQARQAKLDWK